MNMCVCVHVLSVCTVICVYNVCCMCVSAVLGNVLVSHPGGDRCTDSTARSWLRLPGA